MLRVKVFRLREAILKVCFGISILAFIYLLLMISLNIINTQSRTFAAGVVEDAISYDVAYLDGRLNMNVLKDELGFREKINKTNLNDLNSNSDLGSNKSNIKEDKLKKEEKDEEEKENKIDFTKYVGTEDIKVWDRPKSYTVNQLSSGKVQVGNAYISNYIGNKLDAQKLSKVSKFKINEDINILIVHTHTSEGYIESGVDTNFRTLEDSMNVVSVGDVLEKNLLSKNFKVKHIDTKHDTPSYNGSYSACLKTVQEEFKNTKYDIVLDIHRDALSSNLNYRPTAEINGESAAKLMFVVGTNASGLSHDNWMENLKLALLIQNTANEMYPGLFRDLNLSKSRYNQHVCDGALILEVGATGNTLDEVWNSMKYFANVLDALKL